MSDNAIHAQSANFRLGDDTLHISQTDDGIIATLITQDAEELEVFRVTNRTRKFQKFTVFDNILAVPYDFDEPYRKELTLLHPGDRPPVYMRDGRLYCRKCHCWVPNTANAKMRKEGGFVHSHVCGIRAEGEIYEDDPESSAALET